MPKKYVNFEDPETKYRRSINAELARRKSPSKKKPPKKKNVKPKLIGQSHKSWKGDERNRYSPEQLKNLEKSNGVKQIYDILEANRIKEERQKEFEQKTLIISSI